MSNPPALHSFNLQQIARRLVVEAGFSPDFPPGFESQFHPLAPSEGGDVSDNIRDLRGLLWSSIDNRESRDLDQIEVAERLPSSDEIRLLIGIADVDSVVSKGSPLDLHAAGNTTSIYMGVATFPLFPPEISNDLTSLLEGHDRLVVVIDIVVDSQGKLSSTDVYRALARNHAKLDYESIGAWLEEGAELPPPTNALTGLAEQLRLQSAAAKRLGDERIRSGALEFESIEPQPVMDGTDIVDLKVQRKNRARALIENLMVAANSAMATYLEARGWPTIQRVVRTPERWARIVALAAEYGGRLPSAPDSVELAKFLASRRTLDPDHFADLSLAIVKLIGAGEYVLVRNASEELGHFGLAVHDYTHATAPNRRYPDIVTQRLLKAMIARASCPSTAEELEAIAQHCNERAKAARKVERQMRKVAGALFLSGRIGQTFEAMVTGVSPKGTFVRIKDPPVEGRVLHGEAGMEVGQKVRVRLIGTVPERGFIDFARAS